MNNLQRRILDVLTSSGAVRFACTDDHERRWEVVARELSENMLAFCLMPKWKQEAMKMLPDCALESLCAGGEWSGINAACDREPMYLTYRLKPDYVFEADAPPTAEGVFERDANIEDYQDWMDIKIESRSGRLVFNNPYRTHVVDGKLVDTYEVISRAVDLPGFMGYVHESKHGEPIVTNTTWLNCHNDGRGHAVAVRFCKRGGK